MFRDADRIKAMLDLHNSNPLAASVTISGSLFRWMLRRCLRLKNTEQIPLKVPEEE